MDQDTEFGKQFAVAILNYAPYGIQGPYVGNKVYENLGPFREHFDEIEVEVRLFGDGGDTVRVKQSPQEREVFVPHFYYAPSAAQHTMIGTQVAGALHRAGARKVYFLETYNPYYRQDCRSPAKREAVAARQVADFYVHSGVDRVLVFDPHFRQLEGFFPDRYPMVSLDLTEKFAGYLFRHHRDAIERADFIGCATDDGSVRITKRLMRVLNKELARDTALYIARLDKDRIAEEEDVITTNAIFGEVRGRNIIIREDVIGTGTTAEKSVKTLRDVGAGDIWVVATYVGNVPPERLEYFRKEKIKIITTDGIPRGVNQDFSVMEIPPIASRIISRTVRRKSLSEYMAKLDVE